MINENSVEDKNVKKLMKYLDMSFEEYKKRFEGSRPLKGYVTNICPNNLYEMDPEDRDFCRSNISSKFSLKKLGDINIKIYFRKKVESQKLQGISIIDAITTHMDALVHKDIVKQMLALCPDDFEAVPVTLSNAKKDAEHFENKDFYTINALRCIKAIDEEKSTLKWSEQGIVYISKIVYKENPWQDGCDVLFGRDAPKDTNRYPPKPLNKPCMIAVDALTGGVVWHPKLAALIPPHPFFYFARDVDLRGLG